MQINPYLNFDGQSEEAFRFYADALGGELTEIHRFSSMPAQEGFELSEELGNRVMHVGLTLPGGGMLMASDTFPGMGAPRVEGTNISISVHPDSRDHADRIFAALSAGGSITHPLEDQFWGDYFGSLTDKFGVQWMVNYSAQGAAG